MAYHVLSRLSCMRFPGKTDHILCKCREKRVSFMRMHFVDVQMGNEKKSYTVQNRG